MEKILEDPELPVQQLLSFSKSEEDDYSWMNDKERMN